MTGSMTSRVLLSLAILSAACEIDKQLGDGSTEGVADSNTTSTDPLALENAAASMAAARCAAYFACGCNDTTWTSQADCEARLGDVYDSLVSAGQDSALTYDPACVAEYVAFYDPPDCSAISAVSEAAWSDVLRCPIFHGSSVAGQPCEGDGILFPNNTSCAPGLVCTDGTCGEVRADGEVCGDLLDFSCAFGSYCNDATDPPRCTRYAALAEPCGDDLYCGPELACFLDGGTCIPIPGAGESCTALDVCSYGGTCDPETSTCVGVPAACTPHFVNLEGTCEGAEVLANVFVSGNSDCEVDEDCVAVAADCAQHPNARCGHVPLDADYDPDAWAEVANELEDLCGPCVVNDCEPTARCVDNQCTLL